MPDDKKRDRWDKAQVLLDPIGKILTALAVCGLGYYGNKALQEDQKRRAFVELLSRREEADSNLRKDMFGKVIDQFVGPAKNGNLESRLLNLELLAYNFHESIDLGPLLKQVYVNSWTDKQATSAQRKRLQKLAQDIVSRELDALRETGCAARGEIAFDQLEKGPQIGVITVACPEGHGLRKKWFRVDVMTNPEATDLRKQTEVDVVLSVRPSKELQDQERRMEFTVSPFDFPLIDNVRLEDQSRVSVAMTRVDDGGVTLTLAYFPGSRSSLKDKPFNDEVLRTLDERRAGP
jgi:hypothetical protein